MRTPSTDHRAMPDRGTVVACACGGTLLTLAPGEGVYSRGLLLRELADENETRKGKCAQCGAEYTIPVSRWNQ